MEIQRSIRINTLARIFTAIFLFILLYFFYLGVKNAPTELDSLKIHLPIAKIILKGQVFNKHIYTYIYEYYPGAAEIILSVLMFLKIPLNLYNLFGLIFLWLVSRKYLKLSKLSAELSAIGASAICLLPVIFRFPQTQKPDLWLAGFFISSLLLLQFPKNTAKHFFLLGLALGFLIGSKYTGLYYALILIILYYKHFKKVPLTNWLCFLAPLVTFGFSWYLRNYLFVNNPVYPYFGKSIVAGKLNGFPILFFTLWQKPLLLIKLFEAILSEYLLIPFLVLIPLIAEKRLNKLSFLGILNFLPLFFLLTIPESFVSGMRYALPALIPLLLNFFLWIGKNKKRQFYLLIILLQIIFSLTNLNYYPKMIIMLLMIMMLTKIVS